MEIMFSSLQQQSQFCVHGDELQHNATHIGV